jgi:hypothetical protein
MARRFTLQTLDYLLETGYLPARAARGLMARRYREIAASSLPEKRKRAQLLDMASFEARAEIARDREEAHQGKTRKSKHMREFYPPVV